MRLVLCALGSSKGPVYYKGEQAGPNCVMLACLKIEDGRLPCSTARSPNTRCCARCMILQILFKWSTATGRLKVDIWSGAHPAWQGKKGKDFLASLKGFAISFSTVLQCSRHATIQYRARFFWTTLLLPSQILLILYCQTGADCLRPEVPRKVRYGSRRLWRAGNGASEGRCLSCGVESLWIGFHLLLYNLDGCKYERGCCVTGQRGAEEEARGPGCLPSSSCCVSFVRSSATQEMAAQGLKVY